MHQETMRAVSADETLMIAYRAYADGDDYRNAFDWAEHKEHRDGALWQAFMAGWRAAGGHP